MHIPRLSTAASALAVLLLMGPAAPAQALECAPGYLPAVVDGVETCIVSTYSPAVPAPSYNPGESNYDPSTGNYSEAVPAVPVPAAPAEPTPETTPSVTPSAPAVVTESTGGTTGGGTGGNPSTGTTSPSPSRTASPSPSATDAADEERTASNLALPAIAAVVILGLLAGGLLLRHRNRSRG